MIINKIHFGFPGKLHFYTAVNKAVPNDMKVSVKGVSDDTNVSIEPVPNHINVSKRFVFDDTNWSWKYEKYISCTNP